MDTIFVNTAKQAWRNVSAMQAVKNKIFIAEDTVLYEDEEVMFIWNGFQHHTYFIDNGIYRDGQLY